MRRRLRALTGLLLAAALVAAAGQATAQPRKAHRAAVPVSHAGRWIVDAGGRVLSDHGFNVVSKLAPYDPAANGFGADDARFLQQHGFTLVRLRAPSAAGAPAPGPVDARYLDGGAATG